MSLSQATSETGSIALWTQVSQVWSTCGCLAYNGRPLVLRSVSSEAGSALGSLVIIIIIITFIYKVHFLQIAQSAVHSKH